MQPTSDEARFWIWFQANHNRLRAMMYGADDDARAVASAELREAVKDFDPGFILELGPREEGVNTLIVSADGRPERVDGVKDFVASAPAMPGWKVIAFRPRMEINDDVEIVLQGERIGANDIWFQVEEIDEGLALTLHVRGLTSKNERARSLGATLVAEHAVGERDALTLLNSLDVQPLPKNPDATGLRPFRDLVEVFDREKAARYPSPEDLVIVEDSWLSGRGSIQNALTFILFNSGLQSYAGHPDYDRCLTVTIPYHKVRDDGMPEDEEELEAVHAVGDRLTDELQDRQESLLAMTLTTQGRRDLVFYTSNPERALSKIKALGREITSHRFRAVVERDTFWGMYRSFLKGMTSAGDEEESEEPE